MHQDRCEECGEITPGYDTVHYGSLDSGYRQLCTRCFNAEVAELHGLDDFGNIRLTPWFASTILAGRRQLSWPVKRGN